MADRATLAVIDCVRAGVTATTTAAIAEGAKFANDGQTFLYCLDTVGDAILTFKTPGTVDGLAIAELAVTVTASATIGELIGPFPPSIYNQTDGTVHVTPNDHTSLNYVPVRVPR
jgi:hypothetical protein